MSGAFTLTLDTTAPTATWTPEAEPGVVSITAVTDEPATITDAVLEDTMGGTFVGSVGGLLVRFFATPEPGNVTLTARLTDHYGNTALRTFTFSLLGLGKLRASQTIRRLLSWVRLAG